jgi:hypothetical protein
MPQFKIGERVALNGLLGKLHGGEAMGTVVFVAPDRHGMEVFDEYEVAFEDSRQLRVRSFQLTNSETHLKRLWYVLHIRGGFVPVTVKKLRQLELEFMVPTHAPNVIFAKLIPEQRASVSFIVGVMGISELASELVRSENSPMIRRASGID